MAILLLAGVLGFIGGTGVQARSPAERPAATETRPQLPVRQDPIEDIPSSPILPIEQDALPSSAIERDGSDPAYLTPKPVEPNAIKPEAAPRVSAGPNETTATPRIPSALNSIYEDYAEILSSHVRENGLVDYGDLRRRRLELKAILMKLDELDPNVYQGLPREEQLAFWINAHTLKTLEIIARNYPIESSWWLRLTWPPSDIRHIKGIWTDYKFIVMDEEFTLAEVEKRFFRKTFNEPRAFLAITYASRSSPSLRRRLYRGQDLNRQLDEQVKAFLSGPAGMRIDRRDKVVRFSALFKPSWRGQEFVRRYGTDKKFKDRDPATRAVLSFLSNYLSRDDVYFLETENYAIKPMNFDWRLNDTARGF